MASVKVVFATITGNNEDVADIIGEALENKGITVDVEEISQDDAFDLEEFDGVIVCPYTYDEGALPDEGMDFYEELKDVYLYGKDYGVADLGDTFYGEYVCTGVDDFRTQLAKAIDNKSTVNVKINQAID